MIDVIIVLMKRKALVLFLALLAVFLFSTVTQASAVKKRVWTAAISTTSTAGSSKFSVSAKLTGWKQYLNLSFKGVSGTAGVTYELIYNGNGTQQGVFDQIKPSEGNVTRSIFFGTCSHGACTAQKNIGDIHLTITYKTTDGQTLVKKYKVKY
jgi:hypothetical protein